SFAPPPSRSDRLITYINVLGSTPLSFRTPPLAEDVVILPPPGNARIRVRATGNKYQMNVLLYDVDPATGKRRPLNRGHRQSADPNVERMLDFELTSILHTVKAGHVIEALVNGGLALFPDQATTFGNFVLGTVHPSINTFMFGGDDPSRLQLWVEDNATSDTRPSPPLHAYRLLPAWPNPASDRATIAFEVPTPASMRVTLHDAMGRVIRTVAEGTVSAGTHTLELLTMDLRTGIYFYRVAMGDDVRWGRLAVLR
ncbi:MAG: T9SS type A sorting domain-containing protein, partial [Bacteroidetes bacterium]|nr:T9SS type A sorting domain-containing protein [Bacteroidota bacterium]